MIKMWGKQWMIDADIPGFVTICITDTDKDEVIEYHINVREISYTSYVNNKERREFSIFVEKKEIFSLYFNPESKKERDGLMEGFYEDYMKAFKEATRLIPKRMKRLDEQFS